MKNQQPTDPVGSLHERTQTRHAELDVGGADRGCRRKSCTVPVSNGGEPAPALKAGLFRHGDAARRSKQARQGSSHETAAIANANVELGVPRLRSLVGRPDRVCGLLVFH